MKKLTHKEINSLYLTLYNRAPEGAGQKYWLGEAKAKGYDLKDAANAMLETEASKEFFKGKNSSIDFIDHIYKNLLGKDKTVDPEGVAFWASHIDNGMSKGEVVVNMLDAAENQIFADPAAKQAQDLYKNKLKVAELVSKLEENVYNKGFKINPQTGKKELVEITLQEKIQPFIDIAQNTKATDTIADVLANIATEFKEHDIPGKMAAEFADIAMLQFGIGHEHQAELTDLVSSTLLGYAVDVEKIAQKHEPIASYGDDILAVTLVGISDTENIDLILS